MKTKTSYIRIWTLTLLIICGLAAGCLADSPMGISRNQRNQLKALAANTRDRTGRERDALRRAREDLLRAYSSYVIDGHKIKASHDRISAAQYNLLNIHLDNEIALRYILTADQFQAFRDALKKHKRNPKMLLLSPPEDAVLNKLPDKPMLDSLGLSQSQKKQLRPARINMKTIQELRDASKQILDLYSTYNIDSNAARKLIENIHKKQMALLALQQHRQQVIRQTLSPDQFQLLQQAIAKKMAERQDRKWQGEKR